jgi:biotin transporter BioY
LPHDVFVSYSSDDKPTADAVCATLENKGIRCWIAPRDILPGVDWGGAIVDAINSSRVMVLVYSAKANESPQIKREVERAVHRGLSIIPFRIEDVPMSKTLEYFMSMPHWLDALTPPLQNHLDRLAETTRLILEHAGAVLAPPPGGQTIPPPKAPPFTTSGDIAKRIGGWITGGLESPTLAAMFVPRSDKVAMTVLVAASVVAVSVLAQVRIGPIWLQPLAVLLTGAALGSRAGALAVTIYIALAILGLPVFGPGISAWTSVGYGSTPYVRYGLGYLAGLTAAAFAVGWLSERRSWDRRHASAARLALVGIAFMYVLGLVWLEGAALLMRETHAPAGVLPSIPMLVITLAVVAFALPRAWAAAASMKRAQSESTPEAAPVQTAPNEPTDPRSPR